MQTFKIKDVQQELNRYLKEFDTNIIGIRKEGSKIIFETEKLVDRNVKSNIKE